MIRLIAAPFKFLIRLAKRLLSISLVLFFGWLLAIVTLLIFTSPPSSGVTGLQSTSSPNIVNDVTGMNPTQVAQTKAPESVEEIQKLVKEHSGPISIGGGRYSMGGQVAAQGSLHLDLRKLNKILLIDSGKKQIVVQSGTTWRQIQEAIDPHGLSVRIMQSYSNFTVGGSLSVNVHGRYIGEGPLVGSVESVKVLLANGEIVEANRTKNFDVFQAAIGGYGGIGIIVEATLRLDENVRVRREMTRVQPAEYPDFFRTSIRDNKTTVFHNGDLLPPNFDMVYAVSWKKTHEDLTQQEKFWSEGEQGYFDSFLSFLLRTAPNGFRLRRFVERFRYQSNPVVWRNHEASYNVSQLGTISDGKTSFVLQEYFIPVERFNEFHQALSGILQKYDVETVNVSIRHAVPDTETLLSWARSEVFAFVLYYRQETDFESRSTVRKWTRELIDAATSLNGAYYLPYQIHATPEQFQRSYPRSSEFFALKQKLDPQYKFRNPLWDAYFQPTPERDYFDKLHDIPHFGRREEQTFLTLPEWYLVYASEDLAFRAEYGRQSQFPFFQAIGRFWLLFSSVYHRTAPKYPTNYAYHFMNAVIGTTTTIEYGIKGAYENTIGRITEWWEGEEAGAVVPSPHIQSVESFIADTYQDYANFIHQTPWYAYPFLDRLDQLWTRDFLGERTVIRHWERKLSFSVELFIKGYLGRLFSWGTGTLYDPESLSIYGVAEGDVQALAAQSEEVKVLSSFGKFSTLQLPRYEKLTQLLKNLLKKDGLPVISFEQLAGNKGIVVTVKAPLEWASENPEIEEVAQWPLFTGQDKKHVALFIPTRLLISFLNETKDKKVEFEHVYDY